MIASQDTSVFSGRSGAAFAAVAMLHIVLCGAFYFGLAQPIIRHLTAPVIVDNIPKSRVKAVVQTAEPRFDQLKLRYDQPEQPGVPGDPENELAVDAKRTDSAGSVEPTHPVQEKITDTGARMDPKHPLHIGPDYYPSGAIRGGQEGRCVVHVSVAADGRIADSSLQAGSGFPLLDEACLSAVRGQRMLPATRDGKPIESNASLPIVWKLTGSH